MRRFPGFFFRLTLLLVAGCEFPAIAASFDCNKAATAQEKAICANPKLSKLDEDTAAAYNRLRGQLSPAGAGAVQQDQREWLVWLRQTCPERYDEARLRACLMDAYSARLYPLQTGLRRVGGITFFPRLKVVTTPDQEKARPLSSDPGFGVGWFSWPEIDQATARQAAWNAAVRKQVIRMSIDGDDRPQPPADFEPSSVADADVTIICRLKAANEQYVSVVVENGTYRHGAPHAYLNVISFQWWVERGRVLKAEDVFRPGSGWQAFLGRRSYEKLTAGEPGNDQPDNPIERKAVADAVKEVHNWSLDARKFKVTFDEYSVPPRTPEPETVELGWDELKPYLATTFDAARLPEPIEPRKP